MIPEEGQRMRKDRQRRMTPPIGSLYHRIFVQFLHQGQGQRSVQEVNTGQVTSTTKKDSFTQKTKFWSKNYNVDDDDM